MKLDQFPPIQDIARRIASQCNTLVDVLERRVEATPRRAAWRSKKNGRWVETSWSEARDRSAAVASWMIGKGMAQGDTMLVIGSTREEWCICDLGGQLAGMVTVGAYPTLAPEQLAYVIDHSDARVVFAEGAANVATIRQQQDKIPKVECIVVWDMDGVEPADDIVPLSEVLGTAVDEGVLTERREAIDPDKTAIIVYTSGTTGPPKGAMLAHRSILEFLESGLGLEFTRSDENLTFLPMAHVAERIAGFYMRVNAGVKTAFASSVSAVLEEVKEVRPTLFGSVPRIFEKAYDKIQGQVDKAPPVRQRLFRWGERVGLEVVDRWQKGQSVPTLLRLQYRLADRLIYSKIREAFGGRVRFFVTGAAPIPQSVLRFFWAVGFPIFEAYGQTECTVITHVNRPGITRLGSVGKPLSCVEQRLADDGEVLVRGPLMFLGYYKNEEATAETIDEDGWLHTGDIGKIDDDGFLYIVDRKKHIIITAGGKNLTPANIENEIKSQDPLISQVHAHGDRRRYVSALVTLSPSEVIDWATEQGMIGQSKADAMKAELMANPLARPEGLDELTQKVGARSEVQARVIEAVRRGNTKLSKVERVKRMILLERELSVAEDEITPTLKAKRKNIEKSFADRFDKLYEDDDYGLTVEGR